MSYCPELIHTNC